MCVFSKGYEEWKCILREKKVTFFFGPEASQRLMSLIWYVKLHGKHCQKVILSLSMPVQYVL